MNSNSVYFTLTVSAPLHIGCGEVYEPMGFVVDSDACELVSFDPSDFLGRLTSNELEKFSAICARGTVDSIQDLYKFMREHREFAEGTRVEVSRAFADHHKEVLVKPKEQFCKEMNQFEIARTAFNPINKQPFIPGSSIKGAIRTAVLNKRNQGATSPIFPGSRELQEHLLNYSFRNIATDPFRLVKVSDFVPVREVKRKIIYAVDVKKKPSDRESAVLHQILEVIEPGAQFWGSITVLPAPRDIRKPVTMEEISRAIIDFYGAEKQREERQLAGINVPPVRFEAADNAMPLRIGRHSGAECVTVAGHRKIKISPPAVRPPKFSNHGALTIWLTSERSKATTTQGLQPMGWAGLSLLDKEQLNVLFRQREATLAEQRQRQQQELAEQARREAARLEQARKEEVLRLEREQQVEVEKNRLAAEEKRWQEMSEAERDLACIRKEEVALRFAANDANDPNQAIWKKIDGAPADIQMAIAQAFRERWQAENHWGKRDCSKKQWEKVQKIKAILGET